MRVMIVGPGRLGAALARRSIARGHETRIVHRSRPRGDLLRGAIVEPIATAGADSADLVLIAGPARHDDASEAQVGAFLDRMGPAPLVVSLLAYAEAPHVLWSRGRRFVRALCSPAVAIADHPAIFVVDAEDASVVGALVAWAGPARFAFGQGSRFEANTALLMATPLHLAVLRHVLRTHDDPCSRDLAIATLAEALALLNAARGDPGAALDLCATPGGWTAGLAGAFDTALRTLGPIGDRIADD